MKIGVIGLRCGQIGGEECAMMDMVSQNTLFLLKYLVNKKLGNVFSLAMNNYSWILAVTLINCQLMIILYLLVETNNLAERFFLSLKYQFLKGYSNQRLDELLLLLTGAVAMFHKWVF